MSDTPRGDEALFILTDQGRVPRRVSVADFKRWHAASFPALLEDANLHIIHEALEAVYAMFTGCNTLYRNHADQTYCDKTWLLFRLLVCWYITDMYPAMMQGNITKGAIPIKSKKIGPVSLTFVDDFVRGQNPQYQDLLAGLKSNPFGNKAYMMIRSSTQRLRITNGSRRRV